MYGTIMHGRLAPGSTREAFRDTLAEGEYMPVPGFVSSHLLTPDGDGDDVWLAVFFTDRDAYRANADDPAQHERYVAFRAHLAADPEWFVGPAPAGAAGPAGHRVHAPSLPTSTPVTPPARP